MDGGGGYVWFVFLEKKKNNSGLHLKWPVGLVLGELLNNLLFNILHLSKLIKNTFSHKSYF